MMKRLLALFLALTMVFTMLPMAAIAEDFEDELAAAEETEPEEMEVSAEESEAPEEQAEAPEELKETEPENLPEETEPEKTEPEETKVPEETEEHEESAEEPGDTELPEEENAEEVMLADSGECGENLNWELDDSGVLTISGTGDMTDYSQGDAPWYAQRRSVKKVVIEDGVTNIGDFAFAGCRNMSSVVIPESVTSIGIWAFLDCINVRKLYIASLESWVKTSFSSFWSSPLAHSMTDNACVYLNEQLLETLDIPAGTTSIPAGCFMNWESVTAVSIPDTVTRIDQRAFCGCKNLKNLTIPGSVVSIGDSAFSFCSSLKTLVIPDNVKSLGYGVFGSCEGLTDVTIGNGIEDISDGAFSGCSALVNVTIPESVKRIGVDTFFCCLKLTTVTIPDSVEILDRNAFQDCRRLTFVQIGKGMKSIGAGAFMYDKKLERVVFTGDAPEFVTEQWDFGGSGAAKTVQAFFEIRTNVYYPCSNPAWTEETKQNYTGSLTWLPLHENENNICTICGEILGPQMETVSGPERLRGGSAASYKAKANAVTTILWKLRPQDMAFAAITASGRLATKAVAEPVDIVLTAYLKSNPEVCMEYTVALVPGVEEIRIFSPDRNSDNGVFSLNYPEEKNMYLCAETMPYASLRGGTWKSSSNQIAAVDETGLVTFKKAGTVTMTFTAGDGSKKTASVKIIAGTPAEGISIVGDAALVSGTRTTLRADFSNTPSVKTVTWSSSNPAVAAVNSKGGVTAKTVYEDVEVVITAKANDGSGVFAEHTLIIRPKANALAIRRDDEIVTGKTVYLDAACGGTVLTAPEGTVWKNSAPGVVTVDNGNVSIVKAGTAVITAVSADGTQTGKVTVRVTTLVKRISLTASDSQPLISGKGKVTLKANVNADATLKTVAWTSSDPTVAVVSGKGVVSAKAGVRYNTEVTITAAAKDGSGITESITLTVIPAATLVNIISEEPLATADGLSIAAGEVLNGRTLILSKGTSFRLGTVVYPNSEEACARQNVVWGYSAKAYIGVSPDGTLTAVKRGAVTITVRTADGKSMNVKIKII